jgi:uncharacterized protein YndB with AHSA1/START domain
MAEETERGSESESQNGSSDGVVSRLSSLKSKDVLLPAAATAAAAAAAGLAAKKGPDLMKLIGGEANEEAEELGRKGAEGAKKALGSRGGFAGKAMSKLVGGGDGGGQKDGKTRRLPIQRWTDVAVPVEKAYEAWTQFEEFPKFMHRVLEVRQEGDDKIHWQEKIWFSSREWDGEIVDRRENDRIAWKSVSGTQHSGVISFHKLDDNLTRVLVTVDFVPTGIVEKMASGMRFVKRAVQSDLARFKAYVEFGEAKGLEYRSKPAEMEQHRDGDDGEQEKEEGGDEEGRAEAREQEDDQGDRGDQDAERQEREKRRQERREAISSS